MMNGGSEDMLCQVNRSQSNTVAPENRNMDPDDAGIPLGREYKMSIFMITNLAKQPPF
jgi:hypothetical protein